MVERAERVLKDCTGECLGQLEFTLFTEGYVEITYANGTIIAPISDMINDTEG